ncbi:uncharacterized protein LOC143635617 [Bidens hawaiensis]|uniref:uncharacterized protein LOC143635617 n=1 Tax=Bidens hawaiensis TaxID=980011 RepID=UPI00404B1A41
MDKTEPTFVPEWLKNTDDKGASKSLRNKSLGNDLGRPTSCSYSRSPYSSPGRRDRDYNNNKERAENRFRDYSDSLANILPSWFEKDGVKRSYRSHSNVSAKHVESSPAAEKMGHDNGKDPFQRDFPSLGSEEKEMDFEFVRVPSPVLSSVVGGDVWTSALADAPVAETNGPTSISATANVTAGRNMAETLAQTPPQMSAGSQRLEELAVKQSRQLIPMTSMPKVLAMSSSDKPKIRVGGQLQIQTSHIVSPRPVSMHADVAKTSSSAYTVGKLHILKSSREKSSTTPIAKETSSPTGGDKLPNSPLAVPMNRKAFTPEKRPSPQAKSRNDFFNLMMKKSMSNNSSSAESTKLVDGRPGEGGTDGGGESITKNGKNDFILYPEEEEVRFLRSLGWEETTEEEGGLAEEEIDSFYRDVSKYVNSRMGFKGIQPKCLMPVILQMGKNGGDTKVDS